MKDIGIIHWALIIIFILFALGACTKPNTVPEKPVLDLLTAVDQGNLRIVNQHINFGTNPNNIFVPIGIPFEGASALHIAVLKSNEEIIKIL